MQRVFQRVNLIVLILAIAGVGALSISNQSLWIDEGGGAIKAVQPALRDWWQAMETEHNSNLQLPLELIYIWGWDKFFGHSEVLLRISNIPWFMLAIFGVFWGSIQRPRFQYWFLVVALLSPFLWFYLNEVRPYIVVFAGASLTFACLLRARWNRADCIQNRWWYALLCLGVLIACSASMAAVPWALCSLIGAAVLLGVPAFLRIAWDRKWTTLFFGLCMASLGGYFLWTMHSGAKASGGRTGLENLVIILYEQLGLMGLGPGRSAPRDEGVKAFANGAFFLIPAVLLLIPVCLQSLRQLRFTLCRKDWALVFLVIGVPLCASLGAGHMMHVRILGRHLMPMMPFVLAGLAVGMERTFRSAGGFSKAAAILLLVLLSLSALEVRFAQRHSKDDYRTAAALAAEALRHGRPVWWAADKLTAQYYRLPVSRGPSPGEALLVMNLSPEEMTLPHGGVVFLSKPDIYDNQRALSTSLENHHWRKIKTLQAFQVWEDGGIPLRAVP